MPSNNSKCSLEFRDQTAEHVLKSGKSATSMAEDLGIDTNTVCRWVRDYRKKHGLPSHHEERRRRGPANQAFRKKDESEIFERNKDLEKQLCTQKKQIADLEEEKEIKIGEHPTHVFRRIALFQFG
jgi:transposase-like protein